jgi:hypothetical protein
MAEEHRTFVIEDNLHGNWIGRFASFADALAELRSIALIPWGQEPNIAPCAGGETCERDYEIAEYDSSQTPWNELRRDSIVTVSAKGVTWSSEFEQA